MSLVRVVEGVSAPPAIGSSTKAPIRVAGERGRGSPTQNQTAAIIPVRPIIVVSCLPTPRPAPPRAPPPRLGDGPPPCLAGAPSGVRHTAGEPVRSLGLSDEVLRVLRVAAEVLERVFAERPLGAVLLAEQPDHRLDQPPRLPAAVLRVVRVEVGLVAEELDPGLEPRDLLLLGLDQLRDAAEPVPDVAPEMLVQLLELARQRLVAPRPRLQPLQPAIERLDHLPQLPVGVGQRLVAPLAPRARPAVKPVRWLPIGSVAFRPRRGLLPLPPALRPPPPPPPPPPRPPAPSPPPGLSPPGCLLVGPPARSSAVSVHSVPAAGSSSDPPAMGPRPRASSHAARSVTSCQSLFLSMPTSSRFNASAAHAAMTPAAGETGPAAPAPAARADALGPGSSAARYSRLDAPGGRSAGRSSPGAGPRAAARGA